MFFVFVYTSEQKFSHEYHANIRKKNRISPGFFPLHPVISTVACYFPVSCYFTGIMLFHLYCSHDHGGEGVEW